MQLDDAWTQAANALPAIVFAAKPDGSVEFVTDRWTDVTGIPASRVTGENWMSVVHPEDLPEMVKAYSQAIAGGTPFTHDLRVRLQDGSHRWFRSACEPMRASDGSIMRWMGVVLDVDELHRSHERFRILGEAVPVIVWSADATGWIDWYNKRWYDFTGQTPEEARGWGWQASHHPDDFAEVMKQWPHAIDTGEPFEMEFRLRRHDGVFHWFLTRVEPLRNESGEVIRWYGSNVDIDDQKKALERSKRVAETLQDVFLPKELPQYPDLAIDGAYIAAERDALVGGDWYDAFELPDKSIVFSIGDVAGHGLEASVLVGRLRQAIYTLALKGEEPGQILADLNAILQHQYPGIFVTAIAGAVSPDRSHIVYANAGHPPPVLAGPQAGGALVPGGGDLALGVLPQTNYANRKIRLERPCLIVLYTDGMTEFARDISAAEEKLKVAASLVVRDESVMRAARTIQDLVLDQNVTFDDAAILTLHFGDFADRPGKGNEPPQERSWRFHSSDAYSAHAARREIMTYLSEFAQTPAEKFATELVTGELLANTVEHAPGVVEIHVEWENGRAILTVCDSGPGIYQAFYDLPEDPMDENGRGLYLVKQLALDVNIKPARGFGSEVRVTLPLRTGSGA